MTNEPDNAVQLEEAETEEKQLSASDPPGKTLQDEYTPSKSDSPTTTTAAASTTVKCAKCARKSARKGRFGANY
jgi:hypothetical protein